jgi:hypothetical protein
MTCEIKPKTNATLFESKGGLISTFKSCRFTPSEFIKVPVNIGDALTDATMHWKDFKLYCRFLDLKAQSPNSGTFHIYHSHRFYQRVIASLIKKGWADRTNRVVRLRAYPFVWKDLGITRCRDRKKGKLYFKYWKLRIDQFSDDRKIYIKEIEDEIRKRIAKRKRIQMRHALQQRRDDGSKPVDRATFGAHGSARLFGYKSPASGSKLRKTFFTVVEGENQKPYFDVKEMRYKEPCKEIHL